MYQEVLLMKKWGILALAAISLGFMACSGKSDNAVSSRIDDHEDSIGQEALPQTKDGSSSSGESSGEYTCKVTRSANSVKVVEELEGYGSYISEVTGVDGSLYIETEYSFASSSMAEESCAEWKQDASGWLDGSMSVKCVDNTVYISEYDEGTLDGHEENFNEMCKTDKAAYESGAIEY